MSQERTDQHRDQAPLSEVGITSRTVGVGLRRIINQAVVTSFSGGYQSMEFTGGANRDFNGAVLDATATWILTDTTRIEVHGRRQPYQSFFGNNNFYVNNFGGIRIVQQVGRSLYAIVSGSYQTNLYPEREPSLSARRRDRDRSLEFGVGYRFLPSLRVFVGYNSNRRDSKFESADYDVNRMTFRLEMGWL
jgi:hypothetical protein